MDELDAVRQLLAEPPPSPDVVGAARTALEQAGVASPHGAAPVHLNGSGHLFGPAPARRGRRWRGLLAPVAAAAAIVTAVAISVAISGGIRQHRPPARPADLPGIGLVPPYFVALTGGNTLPEKGQRAVVVATATGAILGSVTAPKPYGMFTEVTAAGNDRTFVLAAQRETLFQRRPLLFQGTGPAKLYKLVLSRSGKPATLTPLPIAPVTGSIDGFALSPDGSKLAVTLQPPTRMVRPGHAPPPRGARLLVFTLATGAERNWVMPGVGWLGDHKPNPLTVSWADDDRTLLFEEHLGEGGPIARLFLLDTAAPGSSLAADSRRIPIPSADISGGVENPPLNLGGPFLITGDGTKFIGTTGAATLNRAPARNKHLYQQGLQVLDGLWRALHEDRVRHASGTVIQQANQRIKQAAARIRKYQPTYTTVVTVTEVSVRTGKPVLVLGQRRVPGWASQWALWTNPTGTALIVAGLQGNDQPVLGIQAGNTFTPLPPRVQRYIGRVPAW
jgi:hypothetical protein